MANANWSNPTLSSTYTNFVAEVKNRDEDVATQFSSFSGSNQPTGAIRWDSSANRWKKWTGSSWGELTATYALTALTTTGTATIGGNTTVTGTLDVSGGVTAGSFAPDSNTAPANGISLSAANQLLFSTNSNPRITITSGGDVGIGKTSPTTTLDVAGGIKAAGASGYTFNTNDTDGGLFSPADNKLQLKTNNTTRIHIDGSTIGIGTESPSGHLHVNNASNATCNLIISNAEGTAILRADGDLLNYDADGHKFRTEAGAELLTLDTSGLLRLLKTGSKMAINKTTAATELDVNGTVTATTFSGSGASLTSLPATALSGLVPNANLPSSIESSITGNAATATKLATARTIGGVSFDGSASISLPGVNQAGTQNTSGSSGSCTGNSSTATNIQKNGTNQLLYQSANNTTAVLSSAGTSGQLLKSNGSGSAPSWVDQQTLTSVTFARAWDEKSSGTSGGASGSANNWHTRDLNQTQGANWLTLSNDQFTLVGAGTYFIRFNSPGYSIIRFQARLYDVTSSTERALGTSNESSSSGEELNVWSSGSYVATQTGNVTYRIEMIHSNVSISNGHGKPKSLSSPEIYTTVEVIKVA